VAEHLATALVREGLAGRTWSGLHRIRPVRKSATANAGRRPTVLSHYDSFAIDDSVEALERIILIDDVVSKGRTLLAAATRVQEAVPHAHILAFAMVRTMGLVPDVTHLVDPCGVISRGRRAMRTETRRRISRCYYDPGLARAGECTPKKVQLYPK
jgi:hypothetical protein